jgi:hypothetical protein
VKLLIKKLPPPLIACQCTQPYAMSVPCDRQLQHYCDYIGVNFTVGVKCRFMTCGAQWKVLQKKKWEMFYVCSLSVFMTDIFFIQKCAYDKQLLTPPQRSLTAGEQALFSEFQGMPKLPCRPQYLKLCMSLQLLLQLCHINGAALSYTFFSCPVI